MPILHVLRRAACAGLLALVSSACATYGFVRQDIGLRHDPESDVLEVLVVSQGLLEHSFASAESIAEDAAGARHVILFGWPFEFDLPELEHQVASSRHPLAPRTLALLEGIEVVDSGVFGPQEGPFSLYQRVSIPRASELLALINETLNTASLEEGEAADYAERFGAASGELLLEHAQAGRSWAAFDAGALVVRIPMSPAGGARAVQQLAKSPDASLKPLAAALTELALADGVATFTFGPDDGGWIRVRPVPERKSGAKPLAAPAGLAFSAEPPEWVVAFLIPGAEPPAGGGKEGEDR